VSRTMFSTIFGKDDEDQVGNAVQGASDGAKNRGRAMLAQGQAQASQASSSYAERAKALFANSREQAAAAAASAQQQASSAAAAAASTDYRAKAQEMIFKTQNAASENWQTQQIFDRSKEAALAAQQQAAAALSPHMEAAQRGLSQVADQFPLLSKDRLDMAALQAAGFGAVGPILQRRKIEAYDSLFVLSEPLRMQLMLALREMVKDAAIADPEMPGCVSNRIEMAVDRFWNDLIVYQEQMVQDAKDAAAGRIPVEHAQLAALGHDPMPLTPFWLRSKMLYHFLPFDKSIFGCAKDPIFWILTIVSMIPIFGCRILFFTVLLAFLLRGCPADEYQLVSYILMFKGTQVISSGLIMAVIATVKYYGCVHSDLGHTCDIDGPGATQDVISGIIDFAGSCVLVWIAFLCLPCSSNSAGSRDLGLGGDDADGMQSDFTMSDSDGSVVGGGMSAWRRFCCCCCRCCRRRWDPSRGGRLAGLLVWDFISFALSCIMLVTLCNVDKTHARPGGRPTVMDNWENLFTWEGIQKAVQEDWTTWEFRTDFFMIRIFYGFLMFPYVIFLIPVLNSILTHTTPTGFNRHGVCVPYMLPPMPKKGH